MSRAYIPELIQVLEVLLMVTTCLSCSYIIQKQKDPNKAHQVKLEVIVKALKWLEVDMDVDEVIISHCPLVLSLGYAVNEPSHS